MKFDKLNEVFNKVKLEQQDFDSLFSFREMRENYEDYSKIIKGRKAVFAIPTIDFALYGGVKPCYVAGIVGETDIGKTTLAQHLTYHNGPHLKDCITLLSSQETAAFDLYERAVQTHYNVSSIEVEQAFQENKQLSRDARALDKRFGNVYSIVKRCSVRDLYYYKLAVEHITQKPVGCLIIDWLGMVPHNDYKNEFDIITNNMLEFNELALHCKIPIFIFLQINKAEGKGGKDLSLHSAKGPSIIEQVSKIFVTINKFDRNVAQEQGMHIDILKAWDAKLINVLNFAVKKKKYGLDKPTACVLQNKKSLELVEYHPKFNYHIEFMKKLKKSKEGANLFEADPF